ncbi:VPLPA-CTERM sorting domain-containing protein [Rhodobacteraceae bacterium N5(2021)]|uniref:VPLPA-CTERM sorting domain-containing protein n=1 Tax=Gymnodinialimonas phycosphaerae TaxID=2841589 RepID=A0A975YFP4_9RHOB|nr:VPLPA-CTERM sorting domain-containing protein [Gymnodinialimonas phycosphaerae]MBY4894982.1 VPLPA-CTERM sorting domain-containing protein [Gymnodinialimonas phycosphaerae]
MFKQFFAVAALATLPMAAQATTLDFDGPNDTAIFSGPNVLVGYIVGDREFSFSQITTSGQVSSGANLFDSLACTNNTTPLVAACGGNDDGDLVPQVQGENGVYGNILIRQQASATLDDDAAGNGSLLMTLTSGPAFTLEGFSAIDGSIISLFHNNVQFFGPVNDRGNRETAQYNTLSVSPIFNVGDTLRVQLLGSGGVDSFQLAAIPLPAGGLLLAAAFGGLAFVRRRKTA